MNELEHRIKALEIKVKILEVTLDTLKNMQLSEQMEGFIQSRKKSLKLVNLINTVSDKPSLDFSKEEESIINVQSAKYAIDSQIAAALKNSGEFSEQYPDDPRYFDYEIESGMTTDWSDNKVKDNDLTRYIGKGLRITSYNGFESERIIVPKEINGQPVISIGEKAFKNASFSELILPSTIEAILKSAFEGCANLKHIDLPDGLEFIGEYCFSKSGLVSFSVPNSVKMIRSNCFYNCNNLHEVALGSRANVLGYNAFKSCSKLSKISLPETVETIESECFSDTAITTLIIPSGVAKISHKAFGDRYSRGSNTVNCVFLGRDTLISVEKYETFFKVAQIYCLPGSAAQKFAREYSILVKPLSEFRLEEKI